MNNYQPDERDVIIRFPTGRDDMALAQWLAENDPDSEMLAGNHRLYRVLRFSTRAHKILFLLALGDSTWVVDKDAFEFAEAAKKQNEEARAIMSRVLDR